jgi:predicted DNA-binding transcriptional regulator YafY
MRTDRQVERILDLARLLEGEKYWTRSELQDLYHVDPSTINRHINVLKSIHCQVEGGRKQGWRIISGGKSFPLAISPSEIGVLDIAGQSLSPTMRTQYQKVIDKLDHSLFNRIEKAVETEQRLYHILPPEAITQYETNFEHLEIAREERRAVRALYRSPKSDQDKAHLLEPYGLFFRGSDWRLLAKSDASDQKWLQFKILRFRDIAPTETQFEIPADFDLTQEVEKMWQSYGGEQTEVKIKVMASHAFMVEEKLRHPSQELIDRLDDGAVIVRYSVPKDEFMWWVLSLGANVEVLEPEELRSEIAQEAQKIFGIYQ